MNFIERLIAGIMKLGMLSFLLVSSCTIVGLAYKQSPWWSLHKVGTEVPGTFFVALRTDNAERPKVKVVPFGHEDTKNSDAQYHLPDGEYFYSWGPGEGDATVKVNSKEDGGELIQVFVTGDTPWSSLSEYRVTNNEIVPLRHSQSSPWVLLGIPILLIVINRLSKPVPKRGQGTENGSEPIDSLSTNLKNNKPKSSWDRE